MIGFALAPKFEPVAPHCADDPVLLLFYGG
jgi:hypothetical protein